MACCSWGNTHRPHPYKPSSLFKIYSGLSRSVHSCWVMVFTNAVRSVRDFFDPSTIFRSKLPSGCNCEFKIMVKCKILRIDHLQDSESFLEAVQPCFQPSLDLFGVCPTGRASLQHPEIMSSSNNHSIMQYRSSNMGLLTKLTMLTVLDLNLDHPPVSKHHFD